MLGSDLVASICKSTHFHTKRSGECIISAITFHSQKGRTIPDVIDRAKL